MANFKDFAASTVAIAPSPATTGTSLSVQSGDGASFPTPPFYITATPPGQLTKLSTSEKLLVTNVSTDTFTITRAQGSTTAKEITAGWTIANAVYADDVLFPAVPIGSLLDFAGTTAPTNYLTCDGSAVSRTTYAALYAVIGTVWGSGDGSTTFNLPDIRRRATIGSGGTGTSTIGNSVGSTGGAETVSLVRNEIPPLPIRAMTDGGGGYNGDLTVLNTGGALGGWGIGVAANNTGTGRLYANNVNDNNVNRTATAHNNMPPEAVVLKIIRYQ